MKISVAIAAYRGEKFIGEQLHSIAAQTRIPDEVIICDDSPDELTRSEAENFSEILPIRYYANPTRLGVTGNFNQALLLATGDIIFLCDQDDTWYPQKIALMSDMLDPAQMQAVFCDSDVTGETGVLRGITHFETRQYGFLRKEPPGIWENQLTHSCRRVPAAGHDMAFTSLLLKKLLPLPPLNNCHDTYLGVAAATLNAWRIIPQTLGTFRRHDQSASQAGQKLSLIRQLNEARHSIKNNSFAWNAALYQAVLERIPELDDTAKSLLSARIQHSENRAAMNRTLFSRVPLIWRELRSGNYTRFGRGWKNVIQDIFFR